ncbi:MAG: ATP-grasp domain-containing protein [Gammaproteobacteria bacterium]|nr:ATP-grasp domain-containing protein [Gammaproteobacteria bacterium]
MTKPLLLLIAQPNSYRIAPYIRAAQTMGLEILIASRGEHSMVSEVNAGLHIELDDLETSLAAILSYADKHPFVGVLGSDDSTVELAAYVAKELQLPHNPPEAAKLTRRKDLARAHLALAGCPVPLHCLININQPLPTQITGLPYPCVLKPINLSASKGVIRVNNTDEFISACQRIQPIIADASDEFEHTHILVEDYIDGIEVAFEGYLQGGTLHQLALFDKPDPLTGPYFAETIYVTPSQLGHADQQKIIQRVSQACQSYGLKTGPIHAELRLDQHEAWILEVACRTIGGDCARSLDQEGEFNLEQLVVALAIGKPVSRRTEQGARGVMMIPVKESGILRRVEGIPAARKVKHIKKVDIIMRDGNELVALPEGNQYPGYIFASAKTSQEVIDALHQAFDKLTFVVAPIFSHHRPH